MKPRLRGIIQLIMILLIYLLVDAMTPTWEADIFKFIAEEPGPFLVGVVKIIKFIIDKWIYISMILALEGLYAIIKNSSIYQYIKKRIERG